MKFFRLIIFVILPVFTLNAYIFAQEKKSVASRCSHSPKIDGNEEDIWQNAVPFSDFVQFDPWLGAEPSQKTEIKILYDDKALYVFARMFDTSPDSILMQLGNRDESPNADRITIKFDTYNNQQDGYIFTVFASGVQADSRYNDYSYNAVWDSKTKKDESGWTAEMRIPYSALRFPKKDVQEWRMQVERNIRRKREEVIWSPEVKEADNRLIYWGYLNGLEKIEPSLRLSFTPYLSAGVEHYPFNQPEMNNYSKFFGGGLDLKYGINESFTLDMTLLPDFSQVQSDDKVKNLSAFETVYYEQRPFFKEAVDLFSKGNLFYSRRIGRTPRNFYNAEALIDSGETLIHNPNSSSLINAFKISGRAKNGLAIGLFNAFTADTWATVERNDGTKRRLLTEPAADYSIIVVDQALKNNSSVYYTNSSFIRNSPNYSSNVSAAGTNLIDKSNTYRFSASGGYSAFYFNKSNNENTAPESNGYKTSLSLSKVNGMIQYGLSQSMLDDKFNANDLGLTLYNNYMSHAAWISYVQNKPKGYFKNYKLSLVYYNNCNYKPFDVTSNSLSINGFTTLMNYFWIWGGISIPLGYEKDYYEPRLPGRFFIKSPEYGADFSFSSDYRKPLALDGNIVEMISEDGKHYSEYMLQPIVRVSNHFLFSYSINAENVKNDIGFASIDSTGDIIFGRRDIETWSQTLSGTYVFVNDLSLGFRARHYWANGIYSAYQTLLQSGNLAGDSNYGINSDFNYTSFNIDMVFSWQFSPGSIFNIVWKYEVLHEGDAFNDSYFVHMGETFEPPARNVISFKLLYYLDYLMLRKDKH